MDLLKVTLPRRGLMLDLIAPEWASPVRKNKHDKSANVNSIV
jgi:hypothetical protein